MKNGLAARDDLTSRHRRHLLRNGTATAGITEEERQSARRFVQTHPNQKEDRWTR